MVASKKQSIWLIVLSALKLAVGIILLILCKFLFDALISLAGSHSSVSAPTIEIWWILALPYMVPAVAGFLAARVKTNGVIGLYMALNIIAMVVAGVFAIGSMIYLVAMTSVGGISCQGIADQCYCSVGHSSSVSFSDYGSDVLGNIRDRQLVDVPVDDCDSLNRAFGLMYGVTAMIITGWFLCLTASIVCCSACCCAPSMTPVVYVQPDHGYVTAIHTTNYPTGQALPFYPPPPPPADESEEMPVKENFRYSRMP